MTLTRRALSAVFPWAFPRDKSAPTESVEPVIAGERVRLRVLRESDAEAMWRIARDPVVTRFLPWEPMASPSAILPRSSASFPT